MTLAELESVEIASDPSKRTSPRWYRESMMMSNAQRSGPGLHQDNFAVNERYSRRRTQYFTCRTYHELDSTYRSGTEISK